MSSLLLLWLISLVIGGAALAVMFGLLLARLVSAALGKTRKAERQRLVPLLLGQTGEPEKQKGKIGAGRDLLAELSVELIQLVRGSDRQRFVERATKMGVPSRLRHHLGSGSARVRMAAAEALAEFGDEKSIERLLAALDDPNPDVRLSVALSLATYGRAPPAIELVDKLGIGTTENSLLTAALFKEIAKDRPTEIKAVILDPKTPAGAKAAAIEALSTSADYSIVPMIASLAQMADADAPELPRYLLALGRLGHPAGEAAVKRGLQSLRWDVRAAAAEAAGQIALESLGLHLKQLLNDPIWWVRFRAAEALVRLGRTGEQLLRQAAIEGPENAYFAASGMLAERGLA